MHVAVALLLGQMFLAMWLSSGGDSPTYDEPSHIGAGVAYVQLHDLRWSPVHPPLARILAGIGARLAGARAPDGGPVHKSLWDYELGRSVLYRSEADPRWTLLLARLPLMLLTLVFGLVAYSFASELFGARGGLIAAALFSLDPNLIGHGRLATTDVPVAGFLLLTTWMTWRSRHGRYRDVALAGVAFGLALASKFTAIPLGVLFAGLVAWAAARSRAGVRPALAARAALAGVALFAALSLATLWSMYLMIDTGVRFPEAFPPLEELHDSAEGALPALIGALPLPEPYRFGIVFNVATDQQKRAAFLAGHHYRGGWLPFYPLALLLKTPLPHVALWITGLIVGMRHLPRRAVAVLAAPALFLAFAMASNTNIGLRHVLFVPMSLAVLTAALGPALTSVWRKSVVAAAVVLSAVSTWNQYPGFLAYTSDVAGGQVNAYRLFVDSNVDWGQDLARLGEYVRDRRVPEPIWLSFFGTVDPREYGLEARDPSRVEPQGIRGFLAISVSHYNASPEAFAWLKGRTPDDILGGSILIFTFPG